MCFINISSDLLLSAGQSTFETAKKGNKKLANPNRRIINKDNLIIKQNRSIRMIQDFKMKLLLLL